MNRQEAAAQYAAALKQGRKAYKEALVRGRYPYPQVLDEIISDAMVAGQTELGVMEIPIDQIVGTVNSLSPQVTLYQSTWYRAYDQNLDGVLCSATGYVDFCDVLEGIRSRTQAPGDGRVLSPGKVWNDRSTLWSNTSPNERL